MEVFRANLQLLEEQQLTAAAAAGGQQAAAVNPTVAVSMGLSSPPRLFLTDSTYPTAAPQLATEMPPPAAAQAVASPSVPAQTPVYAIASNFTNNNTLQYPGNVQQAATQNLLKPFSCQTVNSPTADLTQTSFMYNPLGGQAVPAVTALQATSSSIPRSLSFASTPAAGQQVVINQKLKASPTLISLPSARDHKFMPY